MYLKATDNWFVYPIKNLSYYLSHHEGIQEKFRHTFHAFLTSAEGGKFRTSCSGCYNPGQASGYPQTVQNDMSLLYSTE